MNDDLTPIRPQIPCPAWCDDDATMHDEDYDSQTKTAVARTHGRELASWAGKYFIVAAASEFADFDGSNAVIEPPTLVVTGFDGWDEIQPDDARGLAAALVEAAELFERLEQ